MTARTTAMVNHLDEAKDALERAWNGTNAQWVGDAELLLQSAQVDALIAIAERLESLTEAASMTELGKAARSSLSQVAVQDLSLADIDAFIKRASRRGQLGYLYSRATYFFQREMPDHSPALDNGPQEVK